MSTVGPEHGEGNGPLPPERSIDPVFSARIIDQALAETADGNAQLVLTVRIYAKLHDPHDPAAGSTECKPHERDVLITFVDGDDARLRMATRDLDRLGFSGNDILELHPDHPEGQTFVGKEVLVRRKVVNGFEFYNLAWPREKPKSVAVDALRAQAAALASRIDAVRKHKKANNKGTNRPDG
jgi:hypothetical protein